MSATLNFRRTVDLGVPIAELWPLLANTDRINRAVHLPPVTYSPPSDDGLTRLARAKLLGVLPLSWDEPPFEWVEHDFYGVRRAFHGGPLKEAYVGLRVFPSDGRTRLEIFADVTPRHALGRALARTLVDRKSLGDLEKLARSFESAIQGREPQPFRRPGGRGGVNRSILAQKMKALHAKVDVKLLNALSAHLQGSFDEEVVRMRPFVLADRWGFGRLDVLKAFLYAARGGVLDVNWDILCPNCRVTKAEYSTLSKFKKKAHCETCRVDFNADFDKNVEVRFTVNPALRAAEDKLFCIGGPSNTPHRFAQLRLAAGEARPVEIVLPGRRLYVRALRGAKRLFLRPDPSGPSTVDVSFADGEPSAEELPFKPGRVTLRLRASGPSALWVAVDEESWSDLGATAALVTTLQEFRDLFSSEVLSPGEEVSVRSLAVMFTDLKGSTALYERAGDAGAYALVRRHFTILMEAVRTYRGAVVKTIGDAVMAVFLSGEDALRAALAIQKRVHDYNQTKMHGNEDVIVKLGLHMGPAIAVNSNDKLDYFGTTINVAARVQNESAGGDVVVSRSIFDLKDVQGILDRRRCRAEPFHVNLKGLSDKFELRRIWPDPKVAETA